MECINKYIYSDKKEVYRQAKSIIKFLTEEKLQDLDYFVGDFTKYADSVAQYRYSLDENKKDLVYFNREKIQKTTFDDTALLGTIVHEGTHAIQKNNGILFTFDLCKNLEYINNGLIESAAYFNGIFAMAYGVDKHTQDKYHHDGSENSAKTLHLLFKQLMNGNTFDIALPEIVINNINSRNFKNEIYNKVGEIDIPLKSISISIAIAALIKKDFNIKNTARFLLRKTDLVFDDLNKIQSSAEIDDAFNKIKQINIEIFKGAACSKESYEEHKKELIDSYHTFIKGHTENK